MFSCFALALRRGRSRPELKMMLCFHSLHRTPRSPNLGNMFCAFHADAIPDDISALRQRSSHWRCSRCVLPPPPRRSVVASAFARLGSLTQLVPCRVFSQYPCRCLLVAHGRTKPSVRVKSRRQGRTLRRFAGAWSRWATFLLNVPSRKPFLIQHAPVYYCHGARPEGFSLGTERTAFVFKPRALAQNSEWRSTSDKDEAEKHIQPSSTT